MILTVELVPKSSWFNNMRKVLSKKEWDLVRKAAYRRAGYKCAICKAKGKLHCHEIWSFNDKTHIQKLEGYTALCELCHLVRHIGFASIKASQGKLDYNKVVRHFCKVNKCSKAAFHKHVDAAFELNAKRSEVKWEVDLSKFHKPKKKKKNDYIEKEIIP